MPEQPPDPGHTRPAPHKPLVFLHAEGVPAASEEWVKGLTQQGLELYSHGPLADCQRTRSDYRSLGALLTELAAVASKRPIVLLRAGLAVDPDLLGRICTTLTSTDTMLARTVLSNADPALNPFAGCRGTPPEESTAPAAAVDALGTGVDHQTWSWTSHFVALSAAAVAALAKPGVTAANALHHLESAGGRMLVSDRHFAPDPARPLTAARALDPHESPRPPAWGTLSARLQAWLDAGAPTFRCNADDQAATLHITHGWGGGVARWVSSYLTAERDRSQLQLRAESPQSGAGAGQRLSLYAGDQLDCPLASWWLQPPVQSVDTDNQDYREILDYIIARYGVRELVISSLVGHSLDALRSGLPTVQVLHDHFPLWPLLSVHPAPYLEAGGGGLAAALSGNDGGEFTDRDAAGWQQVSDQYQAALREHEIRLAAPSRAAAELFRSLAEDARELPVTLIPHGADAIPGAGAVAPRPRKDGRLRLVVPGRIQPGKGKQLLMKALPQLSELAHVTLLGSGKHGEDFFGLPGVNVIPQYQPGELRAQLAALAPEVAALLSVVPETFSYTLTEMHQLGVPVIATRVGSFLERIEDGKNGWLIEPNADALIERVRALHADRAVLEKVRKSTPPGSLESMHEAYRTLLDTGRSRHEIPPDLAPPPATEAGAQAWLAMYERTRRLRQESALHAMEQELRQRTNWALEREQALQEEQQRNQQWVAQLQAEIDASREATRLAQAAMTEAVERQERSELALEQLRADFEHLEGVHQQVLASSSWRLTRPLRVLRRMAGNFLSNQAWNPLRWPLLVSALVRNLSTVGPRGTLMRMQHGRQEHGPEADPVEQLESVGDPDPPARLELSSNPLVSVVVPVYNKWTYTAACLRSIAEARTSARFEVIVVDDASTDGTPGRLESVDGLRVVRNAENLGFIGSCNRGAELARGRYLVMLNNDTQVTDGWLDRLLETFAQEPQAGLVGARLLFPDGTLQECGGMVFRDGSGWNYGRGDEPGRPEYMHLREVDYCSGACFMIETALFGDLGGFDDRYSPAYYEDTDLAFKVRESGRTVLIQPRCTVVHHEGISSGTDTSSGIKRYQLINQEKFAERWAEQLRAHPPRIEDSTNPAVVREARDHRLRGRVLFIDATTPEPDQDSGSLRLSNLMRCFRELGFGVGFLAENHAHAGRYTRALQHMGVEVFHEPWVESNAAWFRDNGARFDLVIASRHYVAAHFAALVRKHCPNAAWVFDTVDLHYLREQRLAELENSLPLRRAAEQTRRSELAVIEGADAVLVVSEAEVEVLAEDAPDALVHVVSNIHEVPGRRAEFQARGDLFFVGGYQHPPNVDAAQWFVNRIWPRVRKALPDVRFHLVGSKAPDSVRALHGNGVEFHGYVADLDHYLDQCRLAVAPLRYGAGVKGKVNMSMAHGQPVVATPIAVEGMGVEHGQDVLVAEDEDGFAEQVIRLYREEPLWNRISDGGIANVEQRFSLSAAKRAIEELFDRLGGD